MTILARLLDAAAGQRISHSTETGETSPLPAIATQFAPRDCYRSVPGAVGAACEPFGIVAQSADTFNQPDEVFVGMANLAIDDQDRGDVVAAEIVTRLLLRARQQPSASIEPTVRDLDDPAAGRMAIGVARRRQGGGRARVGRDVGRVLAGGRRLAAGA